MATPDDPTDSEFREKCVDIQTQITSVISIGDRAERLKQLSAIAVNCAEWQAQIDREIEDNRHAYREAADALADHKAAPDREPRAKQLLYASMAAFVLYGAIPGWDPMVIFIPTAAFVGSIGFLELNEAQKGDAQLRDRREKNRIATLEKAIEDAEKKAERVKKLTDYAKEMTLLTAPSAKPGKPPPQTAVSADSIRHS